MAATMQVQQVTAAFYACGFRRGEFKAQTEQVYRGRRNGVVMYEYGDLLSWVRNANKENAQRATAMIHHGYDVKLTVYKGKVAHISVAPTRMPSGIGKVESTDLDNLDSDGLAVVTRII
jgi:hypothetical protein